MQLFPRCTAQGQIWFNTRVGGGGIDVPVFVDETLEGPGPGFSAQLYLQKEGSLTPLTPTTVFQRRGSGAAAIASRYVVPVMVTVPGLPSGSSATLVMRAWESALGSFENAIKAGYNYGESTPFTINLGGDPLPAAYLQNLESFRIIVPEPSSLAILLAATFLLLALNLMHRG